MLFRIIIILSIAYWMIFIEKPTKHLCHEVAAHQIQSSILIGNGIQFFFESIDI